MKNINFHNRINNTRPDVHVMYISSISVVPKHLIIFHATTNSKRPCLPRHVLLYAAPVPRKIFMHPYVVDTANTIPYLNLRCFFRNSSLRHFYHVHIDLMMLVASSANCRGFFCFYYEISY